MSQVIGKKLAAVRRKQQAVRMLRGGVTAAIVMAVGIAAIMLLDRRLELSYSARQILLAVTAAIAAAFVIRDIVRPLFSPPSVEELALDVERARPEFRSRLISAVQLPKAVGDDAEAVSATMVQALVEQVERAVAPMNLAASFPSAPAVRRIGWLLATLIVPALVTFYGGGWPLLQRALLVPGIDLPRQTSVQVIDPDRTIAIGDPVEIIAIAGGVIPKTGQLEYRLASGQIRQHAMEVDPASPDTFSLTLQSVQEGFDYRVTLNDATSPPCRIDAVLRPSVQGIEVTAMPPTYTGESESVRQPGDLGFLVGSKMGLVVRANKPVAESGCMLHLLGDPRDIPLKPDPADATRLTPADGPVSLSPGTVGFLIRLVDEDGVASKDETQYRIAMRPDRPPTVAITSPAEPLVLATEKARLEIGYDAADDIKLASVRLRHRLVVAEGRSTVPAGHGLAGQYFPKSELAGEGFSRVDPDIWFAWANPGETGFDVEWSHSVRWTGTITPERSGTYRFLVNLDDGIRLWIRDQLLMDDWTGGVKNLTSQPVELGMGKPAAIRVEYLNVGGPGRIELSWARDGGESEPVPSSALRPGDPSNPDGGPGVGGIELPVLPSGRSASGRTVIELPALEPTPRPGQVYEVWVEAADGNTETGPGVTRSSLLQVRIVTEAEKRAELAAKLGDYMGRIENVASGQQEASQSLSKAMDPAAASDPDGESPATSGPAGNPVQDADPAGDPVLAPAAVDPQSKR